jgi:hypothetical protein
VTATLDRNVSPPNQALALLVSALANHGKGDIAAAKDQLAQAVDVRERQPFPRLADGSIDERLLLLEYNGWFDWTNVEILRQEVAALVEAKSN